MTRTRNHHLPLLRRRPAKNKRGGGFAAAAALVLSLLQVLLIQLGGGVVVVDAQSCDFFYTVTFRNHQYYLSTFNVKTATSIEIGVMDPRGRNLDIGKSLTIDPTTGKLYGLVGARSNNIKVAEIDKTTGRILSELPTGVAWDEGGNGIAINGAGRMILGQSGHSNNQIYDIDKNTGASTLLGTFDVDTINDIAFDPEGDDNLLFYLGFSMGWILDLNDVQGSMDRISSFSLERRDRHAPPLVTYKFVGFDFVAVGQMYVIPGMYVDPMDEPPIFPVERREPGSYFPTIRLPVRSTGLHYPVGCAFDCDKTAGPAF